MNIERLNAITFDSRNVKKGDIFIALSGENSDGHNFIQECLDRGASLIINEKINSNDRVIGVLEGRKQEVLRELDNEKEDDSENLQDFFKSKTQCG